ncbi:MAG: TonB-dependent receptor, partial [Pacificimonas sp.]
EEAEELLEAASQEDELPNSFVETYNLGTGISIITGENDLGVSFGYYDTDYGIPGRPGAGHHHGEEEGGEDEGGEEEGEELVSIGLEQFRADMRGSFALPGPFERMNLRLGYSDYTHTEFEGDEVGTVFDVEGFEGRLEFSQRATENWRGAVGLQFLTRDFQAVGAEAFILPNITDQYAIFALQEIDFGAVQLEVAGRYERSDVDAPTLNVSRNFDSFSGAVGLTTELRSGLRIGVTGSRSERAPSGTELYADGPHIATQQFEVGDIDLDTESAWGVEVFARDALGPFTFGVSLYANWFDDFIFLSGTGAEEDDLPVFVYGQQDARFYGVEAEVGVPLYNVEALQVRAEVGGDYIDAELDSGDNLPRIPPLSLFGAMELLTDSFDLRGEVEWVDDQTETAPFETPTDGHTFVNASVGWRPFGPENITLLAQVRNIFDVTARRHASFTKDFVPLSGRDIRVSAQFSF